MAEESKTADYSWRPKANPWVIAATVALAAFMEVLDTSIANVALPHIAGSLGASADQSTWVLTSYLVANAIVLPMGAFFATVIGRKNFFMLCIVIFTASSFLCGIAPSLGLLLLFRVLQGAGGGGLQPMAQAIMADSFEEKKRGHKITRVEEPADTTNVVDLMAALKKSLAVNSKAPARKPSQPATVSKLSKSKPRR